MNIVKLEAWNLYRLALVNYNEAQRSVVRGCVGANTVEVQPDVSVSAFLNPRFSKIQKPKLVLIRHLQAYEIIYSKKPDSYQKTRFILI